jgi:hypothetical protein
MNADADGFAPPPFNPATALLQLRRQLRDLKLEERGRQFLLKGRAVLELDAGDTSIVARLVKRPAHNPEWMPQVLNSAADLRRFTDTVRLQLGRWSNDD